MKCLLCDFKSNDKSKWTCDHNVFHGRRCVRCNEFLPTTKFKSYHDFSKHYDAGKNIIEEKPLIVTSIGNVKKFEINYQNRSSDYDFYNSESLVDDFLFNVKNRIERSDVDFFVLCGFSQSINVLVYRSDSN